MGTRIEALIKGTKTISIFPSHIKCNDDFVWPQNNEHLLAFSRAIEKNRSMTKHKCILHTIYDAMRLQTITATFFHLICSYKNGNGLDFWHILKRYRMVLIKSSS